MTYTPPASRILSMSADLSRSYLLQLAELDRQIAALDAHPTLTPKAQHAVRSRLVAARERVEAAYQADKQRFAEVTQ